MVAVAADHARELGFGGAQPAAAGDALPRTQFRIDQQPEPVARVEEFRRLRIVRQAHEIEAQFLDEPRVFRVQRRRQRESEARQVFMPVHAAQRGRFSVQHETPLRIEFRGAQAKRP